MVAESSSLVSLGLIDGTSVTGSLASFSPFQTRFIVDPHEAAPGGVAQSFAVPASRVAFVAFLRGPGEPVSPPPPAGHHKLKVEVAKGSFLDLFAPPPEKWSSLGFYAQPVDPESGAREYFVFIKRVRTGERRLPRPIRQIVLEHQADHLLPHGSDDVLKARRGAKLGDLLVEEGLVTASDVDRALAEQRRLPGRRLGEILGEAGLVTEVELARAFARKFGLPFVDLDEAVINAAASQLVSPGFVRQHGVLPVDVDERTITVALADPLAIDAIDELRARTGKHVLELLVTPTQLAAYAGLPPPRTAPAQPPAPEATRALAHGARPDEPPPPREAADEAGDHDSGVIKLVNQIIYDAVERGASDIHVEPEGPHAPVKVRLRIDGECSPYLELPSGLGPSLASRIKIMAGMDIAERRKPQDGKIRLRAGTTPVELRVATIPTVGGVEDVVLRILPPSTPKPLEQLGFSPRNLRELRRLVSAPYGLVLCVGPTGSGKTTTLHAALGAVNTPDVKIWTAEEPVEITQPGLRQVQVSRRIGLDFAAAMRAFLRADPDIIMVGEMRDHEAASIAIEASLTGHLVLSTLHTNSAPETVVRLLDMGLDPFAFADALLGVLAQRLVRTLCSECREPYAASEAEVRGLVGAYGGEALLAKNLGASPGPRPTLYRAHGCKRCGNSGYRGRAAIHELLVVDDPLRKAIMQRAPMDEIRRLAEQGGMTSLLQDGISKVLAGVTDLRQVQAVCSR